MKANEYKKKKQNVGIVSPPVTKASGIILSNLIEVLNPISENIYIISGNIRKKYDKAHLYSINYKIKVNIFVKVMNYFYLQVRYSYMLAKLRKNVDLWIFFLGGEALLLPILTAKLLNKEVVIPLAGSFKVGGRMGNDKLSYMLTTLRRINYYLSDRIIIYSKKLIKEWSLQKHINKISITREHFLDFDNFRVQKRLNERDDLCGYIGTLEKWKGVLNFVDAITKISERRKNIGFLIVGEGKLQSGIKERVNSNDLNDKVRIIGWIPHDEVPKYLNELKLLVLPSYTEGLPNIVLEAMACGTPVLATSVGAIPDVIKDGENGFIMENNTPECIAENVERALEYPNLDKIVKTAKELVEKEFTYEAAVERYRKILKELS